MASYLDVRGGDRLRIRIERELASMMPVMDTARIEKDSIAGVTALLSLCPTFSIPLVTSKGQPMRLE